MNVVYDISLLGRGLNTPKYRTGIHRVVENTFRGLAKCSDIELTPVSTVADEILNSEAYLEQSPNYTATLAPLLSDEKEANARKRGALKEQIRASKAAAREQFSLVDYFGRKVLRARLRKIPKYSLTTEMQMSGLEETQIYHSSFAPVPNPILDLPKVTSFFTVHDLILIKHPEFFDGNEQTDLSHHLQNLEGKEWICCVSESTRSDLLEVNPGLDPEQVKVTHLAASDHFYPMDDTQAFESVRARYGVPEGPYFLSLSTLEPRKNIVGSIRAFLELLKAGECADASLVLVGGLGWDYASILSEIDGANAHRDRIIVTGFVDDADLAAIYSKALAFLYMSFYEGFGLPPLEAMQCGVPVITSNSSSLPEVVGDAGVLLDARATDDLSQAMLRFYCDAPLRARYGQQSIERAASFSWTKYIDQTVAAYRSALK